MGPCCVSCRSCRELTRLNSLLRPSPLPQTPSNFPPTQNTCDPKWNEPVSFKVPGGSLVDMQLFLRVIGKQKLRDDICLGRVELPLAGITNTADGAGGDGGRWFPLEDGQGRLRIDAALVTRRPSLIV